MNGGAQAVVAVAAAGQREDAGPFHEERPFLAEEGREALVHFHLERVAFHLAEIGIHRGVEGNRRAEADLAAEPDLAAIRHGPAARRVVRLGSPVGDARQQFARRPRPQIREPQRRMALEHPDARRQRRPRHRHAEAADAAPEQDAHARVRAAAEPDALQRQANFDDVAGGGDAAGAVPDPVGRGILTAGRVVDHVGLHAVRVDHHVIRELPGAERVEAEADPVVLPDVVAPRDRRLDALGLRIVAAEGKVQRIGVVADPDGCLLRHTVPVQGVIGQPVAGHDRIAPFELADHAVDPRRLRGGARIDDRARLSHQLRAREEHQESGTGEHAHGHDG